MTRLHQGYDGGHCQRGEAHHPHPAHVAVGRLLQNRLPSNLLTSVTGIRPTTLASPQPIAMGTTVVAKLKEVEIQKSLLPGSPVCAQTAASFNANETMITRPHAAPTMHASAEPRVTICQSPGDAQASHKKPQPTVGSSPSEPASGRRAWPVRKTPLTSLKWAMQPFTQSTSLVYVCFLRRFD